MKLALTLLSCALVLPQFAAAQSSEPMTARSLVDGCDALLRMEAGQDEPAGWSKEQVLGSLIGAGVCTGYIKGFFGGYNFARHEATGPNVEKICIPKGVTSSQIARLFSARLKDKPEFEHLDAYPFAIGVLMGAWPCSQAGSKVK